MFEKIFPDARVFKLIEPMNGGVGRYLLLASCVKKELSGMFGEEYSVIISDRGHLYAFDSFVDYQNAVETLIFGEQQWLENVFDVFKYKEGKYIKVAKAKRESLKK